MLLCLKEHSKKGSQELTFCTRIGIGFAIVEMAHSHSMAKKLSKKLSKELSKKHSKKLSKKHNFYTRIGPLIRGRGCCGCGARMGTWREGGKEGGG